MKRKPKPKTEQSPMWRCPTCLDQMFGGPRCFEHNPTPDEREQNPQAYYRQRFAPSRKKAS